MVLVLNCGSSSVKFKLFNKNETEILSQNLQNITNYKKAFKQIRVDFSKVSTVIHRVVHGGNMFAQHVQINKDVIDQLKYLIPLAPLHNPANIQGIIEFKKLIPKAKHFAVFDTAFHSSIPKKAHLYALPYKFYTKYHIKKYGFHGFSHAFVSKKAAQILNIPYKSFNCITIHLGNGSSITAIKNGKSIDTSMGFTPLEGLMMGSGSGDIDAGILLFLQRELKIDYQELDNILNKQSGLKGICNSNNVQEILQTKTKQNRLAIQMFIYKIIKYIGAYIAILKKVDAIVFTGGIGENSFFIREKISKNLKHFNILLSKKKNIQNKTQISKKTSKIKLLTIKTDEELEMLKNIKS